MKAVWLQRDHRIPLLNASLPCAASGMRVHVPDHAKLFLAGSLPTGLHGHFVRCVCCAELLLPHDLFQPEAERAVIGLAAIEDLAARFQASLTGHRLAIWGRSQRASRFPLSEQGMVRYASRSATLKEAAAWIPPRLDLPDGYAIKY